MPQIPPPSYLFMLLAVSDTFSMESTMPSISMEDGDNFCVFYAYSKHRTSEYPFITGTHEDIVTVRNDNLLRLTKAKGACTPSIATNDNRPQKNSRPGAKPQINRPNTCIRSGPPRGQ